MNVIKEVISINTLWPALCEAPPLAVSTVGIVPLIVPFPVVEETEEDPVTTAVPLSVVALIVSEFLPPPELVRSSLAFVEITSPSLEADKKFPASSVVPPEVETGTITLDAVFSVTVPLLAISVVPTVPVETP